MRGFTLIEILIALAILTLLLGITLPLGWDFYTTTTLQSERDLGKQPCEDMPLPIVIARPMA